MTDTRLLTLLALATITLEATMREQIEAMAARIAELEAAVSRIVELYGAAKANAGDEAAAQELMARLVERVAASTSTLNAQ